RGRAERAKDQQVVGGVVERVHHHAEGERRACVAGAAQAGTDHEADGARRDGEHHQADVAGGEIGYLGLDAEDPHERRSGGDHRRDRDRSERERRRDRLTEDVPRLALGAGADLSRAPGASARVPTAVIPTLTADRICTPIPTAATELAPSRPTISTSTTPTIDSETSVKITGQASDQTACWSSACELARARGAGQTN